MLSDAEILQQAAAWFREGRGVALATVIETWGSAPRAVGAHLVVDVQGAFLGSVSGGCVEGEVITAAIDAIESGAPRVLEFGVADETAWRAGLTCGGRVSIHVERIDAALAALIESVGEERAARRGCALVTPLAGGAHRLLRAEEDDASRASATEIRDGARVFVNRYAPGYRFVIVGAVHVAQALAPMASLAGFDVIVVDPRAAFATAERLPATRFLRQWPDAAFATLGLDAFTAVAVLTHDPKIDDLALTLALPSRCFYVGALGSRKSHARRVERLVAQGVAAKDLERLHAPIGLDIGAATPAEIAVAILGEAIACMRKAALAPVVIRQ
ncbi:XdhC family protein [Methylocystis sp. ATCC 49242]|uniref:XdhC family protein n=1 Tax=Methylocystis sp. ATCC 49242 TaxID=622637 RepID=UPI0001F88483|nr:XdhC/CoxI family protein [Methylocystis sp. ATCC 49242]